MRRPSSTRRWAAVLGALGLAACATFVSQFTGRRDHIRVPHARHKNADVDCISCHETIFDATDLTSVVVPKEKKCLECHKEEKVEKKNYYRLERSYGSFSRSFTLPSGVQADKIKAQFKDGILEVRIPKTEEAKKKEIKVSVG